MEAVPTPVKDQTTFTISQVDACNRHAASLRYPAVLEAAEWLVY
jgi:hypothetical protein